MIRSHLPIVVLVALGALALAIALAAIPYVGVAHSEPMAVQADAVSHTSERADAPRPSAQITDDAEVVRQLGRPIGIGVLATLLALALGAAGANIPWLAWLARGTSATVIGAVSACAEAMLEVALAGGTVLTVEVAGGAAVLAFWRANRPPMRGQTVAIPTRRPEDGSARGAVLVWLATLGLLATGAAAASCAGTGQAIRATATVVIDCAEAVAPSELAKAIPLAEAALEFARQPDGTYDTAALLDVARSMSLATAGCALAEAVSRLRPAVNMRYAISPAETPLDRAWSVVQVEQLGGRSFRIASGQVL